ncbi:lactonase family protein [Burkholderia multivorans]|uniref:lactonase family protein n=1 Tax=Burkholderia multivorans TaxID=87883 RepID=UPI001C2303D9|nr:beta-propeller fold lactonase family protein [Burkholderia multivorans]MBU9363463.1 lactonase family protein [Burkholderia multivorans]
MSEIDFHSAVGATITTWHVDTGAFTLKRHSDVVLPAAVQYAWRHPSLPLLYAAFSDRFSGAGMHHGVATLSIDSRTGALMLAEAPIPLSNRPVHLCVNRAGDCLLVAYNDPSEVSVHRLDTHGGIAPVKSCRTLPAGTYAHQVRVAPDDATVIVPGRGNDSTPDRAEDPGVLEFFDLQRDSLRPVGRIAPNGGFGFGPRHVDFHPNGRWMYASVERQNELQMFELGVRQVPARATFAVSTLASPENWGKEQLAGAIHVSADGRFVYLTNRANGSVLRDGYAVFSGGENNVVAFAINPVTGEPRPVQHAIVQGYHARTMALHPDGRMLVAATLAPMNVVMDGTAAIHRVKAALSVFAVAVDGRLRLARTIEIDTGDEWLFWCGMVRRCA